MDLAPKLAGGLKRQMAGRKGRLGKEQTNSINNAVRMVTAAAAATITAGLNFQRPPSDSGSFGVFQLETGHGESGSACVCATVTVCLFVCSLFLTLPPAVKLIVAGSGPFADFAMRHEEEFINDFYNPWQATVLDSAKDRLTSFLDGVGVHNKENQVKVEDMSRDDAASRIRNAWYFLHTGKLMPAKGKWPAAVAVAAVVSVTL